MRLCKAAFAAAAVHCALALHFCVDGSSLRPGRTVFLGAATWSAALLSLAAPNARFEHAARWLLDPERYALVSGRGVLWGGGGVGCSWEGVAGR